VLRLALSFLGVVALVTSLAIGLGAYLNYGSVRASYVGLIDARMTRSGEGIAADIETALSLGLPLAGQQTLKGLLAREQASDPLIASIDVLDDTGAVLFSSDPARVGRDARGTGVDEDELPRVIPIVNDFGARVGTVALRADRSAMSRALGEAARAIIGVAILALIAALAVVGLCTLVLLRRLTAEIVALDPESGGADALPSLAEVRRRQDAIALAMDGARLSGSA
jgi:hypothetical protein